MTPVSTGPVSGYSSQASISLDVARMINNGRIRFWFAGEFNPIDNQATSNPLRIFEELDTAAKRRTRNEKTAEVEAKLLVWVAKWHKDGLVDDDARAEATHVITTALETGRFRPVIFYLKSVIGAVKEAEPDEYRIENQPVDHPNVRQILPPITDP